MKSNFIRMADAAHRDRNRLAISPGGQPADHRGDARHSQRDPKDRKTHQRRDRTPSFPTGMSGIWSSNGRSSSARRWSKPSAARGRRSRAFGEKLVWAGRAHAGPARPAAGKSRAGARDRDQAVPAPAAVRDPRSCQPRLCRFQAARVARPRARHRRRSALCQQPEFAGVAGAGRLRSLRRASAARRVARAERPGLPGMARSARGPRHQFRDARDGADGQARQSARDHLAAGYRRPQGALRQPRP